MLQNTILYLSLIFSIVALVLTCYNLYRSTSVKFTPLVLPVKRATLTRFNGVPYLVVLCEFSNQGEKSGIIYDLIVNMTHIQKGFKGEFVATLARRELDVFVEKSEKPQMLRDFSAIFLPGKKSIELYVFFAPRNVGYQFVQGDYSLDFGFAYDQNSNYKKSPISFTVRLSESHVKSWEQGSTIKVDSIEIEDSRKRFYTDSN